MKACVCVLSSVSSLQVFSHVCVFILCWSCFFFFYIICNFVMSKFFFIIAESIESSPRKERRKRFDSLVYAHVQAARSDMSECVCWDIFIYSIIILLYI